MRRLTPLAFNGRFSGTLEPTGTQTAAYNLFDAIIRHPDRDFSIEVFADSRFPGIDEWKSFSGVNLVHVPFSEWSRSRAQLWEQLVFPYRCVAAGARLAHHPITTSPAIGNRAVTSVVTLHDVNFLTHREWYSWRFRVAYAITAIPGLHSASAVVAVSQYVRQEAIRTLSLSAQRVHVIYNGVKLLPTPAHVVNATPYILCVGSLQPHKNLNRIIDAWKLVRRKRPALELWIVGRKQPGFRETNDDPELLSHPGVNVLGYVTETKLSRAYAGAVAFVYPSLEEGFGLPVLEAMEAGAPVITSNCSCLPEIAGGAAELVDPTSSESIAAAIENVIGWTENERQAVVARGRERAKQFTWSTAAGQYITLYRELTR
jgi:glycosyltransferase involved in cell wall biosynthesis